MLSEEEIEDSISKNNQRNKELLLLISSKSVDLSQGRTIDHHFWSFDESDANSLSRELNDGGFLIISVNEMEDDGEKTWNVEVQREYSPSEAGSKETTGKLVRTAAKFDSIYDGWGTKI